MEPANNVIRLPDLLTGDASEVWISCLRRVKEIEDNKSRTAALERRACLLVVRRALANMGAD